jgi:hypothetical protein
MNPSLLPDIFHHFFSWIDFRLRDIIILSTVSQQLRRVSLSEEHWYIISDTHRLLYIFVRKMLRLRTTASYPLHKIKQMHSTDSLDIFTFDYKTLLEIVPKDIKYFNRFYNCFTDYQYLYLQGNIDIKSSNVKNMVGIYGTFGNSTKIGFNKMMYIPEIILNNHITEIFLPYCTCDWDYLIKRYPCLGLHLEKLTIGTIYKYDEMVNSNLKYLSTRNYQIDIHKLPVTLESLILHHLYSASLFDHLSTLPYLNYLKMNLPFSDCMSTININTVHFIISNSHREIIIDMPNVKNIIISYNGIDIGPRIKYIELFTVSISSLHATTCQIFNIKIYNPSFNLPNCSQVVIRNI